jgi:hypothetical protein
MANDIGNRLIFNMAEQIRKKRSKLFATALTDGHSAADSRAFADEETRRFYRALVRQFSAEYPVHAYTADRIARQHIEGY